MVIFHRFLYVYQRVIRYFEVNQRYQAFDPWMNLVHFCIWHSGGKPFFCIFFGGTNYWTKVCFQSRAIAIPSYLFGSQTPEFSSKNGTWCFSMCLNSLWHTHLDLLIQNRTQNRQKSPSRDQKSTHQNRTSKDGESSREPISGSAEGMKIHWNHWKELFWSKHQGYTLWLCQNSYWLLKMAIYSGFSHWKWWFSIAMLVYQRV